MIITVTKQIEVNTNKAIVNMRKSLHDAYPWIAENDDETLLKILEDMTAKVQQCVEFSQEMKRK